MELHLFFLLIPLISRCFVNGVNERLRMPSQKTDSDLGADDYDSNVCLGNFQINENTIIRTQDSRTLGARYLNETEFTSKQQCLQWCCQTSDCNVAVYEEKNRGSCYIFDCGSSRNFKCKFTTHNHYTSAILKVNRHLYDLNKWGSETKHEEELSQLREKNLIHATSFPLTSTFASVHKPVTTVATTTISSTTVLPITTTVEVIPSSTTQANAEKSLGPNLDRHCSRFQFECRNTSECIAIYNACDGIPQCSDGSDESEELDCPTGKQRNALKASETVSKINSGGKWKTMQKQNLNFDSVNDEVSGWRQKTSISGKKPQYHPPGYPHQPPVHYSPQELQEQLEAQQQPKKLQTQQLPRQQIYQPEPRLDSQSNAGSVFSHKTSGLLQNKNNLDYQQEKNFHHSPIQESSYVEPYEDSSKDFSDTSYNQRLQPPPQPLPHYPLQDYDDNNDYWPPEREKHIEPLPSYEKSKVPANERSRGHESNMAQPYSHGQSINHDSRDNGMPSRVMQENYDDQNIYPVRNDYSFSKNLPEKSMPVPKPKVSSYSPYANHPHPQNPRMEFPSVKKDYPEQGITNSPLAGMYEPNNKLEDSEQYPLNTINDQGGSLQPVSSNQANILPKKQIQTDKGDPVSEKSSTTRPVQLIPKNVNSHSQLHKVELNLAELEVQKVEHSTESNGAVLALTLGLSVTGILLVLVGCRVRMVRRHLRRGRSPYAHDADYLVNGMYL